MRAELLTLIVPQFKYNHYTSAISDIIRIKSKVGRERKLTKRLETIKASLYERQTETITYLKKVFCPNPGVGARFKILDILQYACGLKPGPAYTLDQNPFFRWVLLTRVEKIGLWDQRLAATFDLLRSHVATRRRSGLVHIETYHNTDQYDIR